MNAQKPAQQIPPLSSGNPVSVRNASGEPPPSVPDYELIRRIGGGAYGDVWLARSTTGALRALKIVWRHTFEDDRPFQREFEGIQLFERLSRGHPSQLALFHVGRNEAAGYFYYVMELADPVTPDAGVSIPDTGLADPGRGNQQPASGIQNPESYTPHTLRADLAQGRLPAVRVLEIGLALAEALAHLHSHGLVHRDVKPSNIIFVGGKPKLADIGLVTDASDTCSIVGTEGYLAPEGPGTPQADLFALGKVLYEALTGLDRRQLPQLPPDLRDWPDARLVFELNEVILKACETDPRRRYASATALGEDLVLLRRGQSVKRRRNFQERIHAARRIALTAAAVVLTAAGVAFFWQTSKRHGAPTIQTINEYGTASTHVAEAIGAYNSGLGGLRRGTAEGFRQALENFTAAIKADPQFVAAHARLFETYLMSQDYDVHHPPPGKAAQLEKLSANLMKLAPTNAETHAALAIVRFLNEWQWAEAEREFSLALKADPNCRMALTYYGYMLTRQRRAKEARIMLERALNFDRGSPLVTKFLGHCEYVERRYEKALPYYRSASRLEPSYPSSHYWAGRAFLARPNYPPALDEFEEHERKQELPRSRENYTILRQAWEKNGPRDCWAKCLEMINDSKIDFPYWYSECHARLGDRAQALAGLEEALVQRDTVEDLLMDEFWDDYRDDPKFKEILKKVRLDKWAR